MIENVQLWQKMDTHPVFKNAKSKVSKGATHQNKKVRQVFERGEKLRRNLWRLAACLVSGWPPTPIALSQAEEGAWGDSGQRPKFFCKNYFCFHFPTQPKKQCMPMGSEYVTRQKETKCQMWNVFAKSDSFDPQECSTDPRPPSSNPTGLTVSGMRDTLSLNWDTLLPECDDTMWVYFLAKSSISKMSPSMPNIS